ncbi:MAG: hypothetical protein R6X32_22690 [Chloroflexota bacterium]
MNLLTKWQIRPGDFKLGRGMVAMFGLLLLVTLFCIRTLVTMPQRRDQNNMIGAAS